MALLKLLIGHATITYTHMHARTQNNTCILADAHLLAHLCAYSRAPAKSRTCAHTTRPNNNQTVFGGKRRSKSGNFHGEQRQEKQENRYLAFSRQLHATHIPLRLFNLPSALFHLMFCSRPLAVSLRLCLLLCLLYLRLCLCL